MRATLAEEMQGKGFDLRFDSNIESIEKCGNGLRARLEDGSSLDADVILYATGRAPKTRGIGLEEVGVELASNGAVVNS